jgi:hypothetical protein
MDRLEWNIPCIARSKHAHGMQSCFDGSDIVGKQVLQKWLGLVSSISCLSIESWSGKP